MAQFARPNADDVRTGWTEDDGTTVAIFDQIDEASPDDLDYIKTAAPPGSNEYEAGLSSVTDPVSSTGHIMRWRRQKDASAGATINLTVRLLQGVTQITSQADNAIPSAWATTSYTLSGAEADAITDYTILNMEFVAAQV